MLEFYCIVLHLFKVGNSTDTVYSKISHHKNNKIKEKKEKKKKKTKGDGDDRDRVYRPGKQAVRHTYKELWHF